MQPQPRVLQRAGPLMTDRSYRDDNDDIGAFRHKLDKDFTVRPVGRQPFVLTEKLRSWLREPVEHNGRRITNAEKLLQAAHSKRQGRPVIPVTAAHITMGDKCCLLIFCILLNINHGHLIGHFWQSKQGFDFYLPMTTPHILSILDDNRIRGGDEIARSFVEEQSRFCPVSFDLGEIVRSKQKPGSEMQRIMPICEREWIRTEDGVQLFRILVQEDFIGHRLSKAQNGNLIASSKIYHEKFGPCYAFALKTYEGRDYEVFDQERKAFQNFCGLVSTTTSKHLVQYICHYEEELPSDASPTSPRFKDRTAPRTYNIVFEYSDMHLDECFTEYVPPVLPRELVDFWGKIFGLAEALKGLHLFAKHDHSSGGFEYYNGWHAEINPTHIAHVQFKFKFMPSRLSRSKPEADSGVAPLTAIEKAINTYSAPEWSEPRQTLNKVVHQGIDVWSLGCVFSVAATWIVLGFQGINQFETLRSLAIEKIQKLRKLQSGKANDNLCIDGFHNGISVLPEIKEWHIFLRQSMRRTDEITGQVLDLVDRYMLVSVPDDRIHAKDLVVALDDILSGAKKKMDNLDDVPVISASVAEALLEYDTVAANGTSCYQAKTRPLSLKVPYEKQRGLHSSVDLSREESRQFIPSMQTIGRSEYLQSLRIAESEYPPLDSLPATPVRQTSAPVIEYTREESPTSGEEVPSREVSNLSINFLTPPTSPDKPPTSSSISLALTVRKMTVEEARLQLRKKVKVPFFNKPDVFLKQHFKERDIKFLVDNGSTMTEHWDKATELIDILAQLAVGLDKDGMDLVFTNSSETVSNHNWHGWFKNAMRRAKPQDLVYTDIKAALGNIFGEYQNSSRFRKPPKRTTLIILTDGVWKGTEVKEDVEEKIQVFIKWLMGVSGGHEDRSFSIQFIQFGNDLEATQRLKRLDDELVKLKGIPDIVDTEPADGNIYKMLLGSFVEHFDRSESRPMSRASSSSGLKGIQSTGDFWR
ncbi:hypothetical protein EJ06DRAFT_420275 [Trichodelitschia bisporula]|uniref:Protein kinase domain-containing protein n=1 Tax=Trichodelitschia bisporula TaxID=703511 RepID=A0A6G1HVV7_9PEZI|nr:hypothetical protein EJ06DRAFT_420275 [Trichodelitschia bisporula]